MTRAQDALRIFTPEGFALASLWAQLVALAAGSAVAILAFAPLVGSLKQSYVLFFDPSCYADLEGAWHLFFGVFHAACGLVLYSAVISVLWSAQDQFVARMRDGALAFRRRGHLLIVQRNARLSLILDEINERQTQLGRRLDVVILLGRGAEVREFEAALERKSWPFLRLCLRQGDLLAMATYRRVSIFAASGVVVLSPEGTESRFLADNQNLKILTALLNDEAFRAHLARRRAAKQPVKCAVELSGESRSREVADALTRQGSEPLFAVASPEGIVGQLLSRSVIDPAHHRLFRELLSFGGNSVHFVDPARFATQGLRHGMTFENVSRGFAGGSVIGYSRMATDDLDLRLVPMGEALTEGDWLVIIAADVATLRFECAPAVLDLAVASPAGLSRGTQRRRIGVVGAERVFEDLADFLHPHSRPGFQTGRFVFPDADQYFEADFVRALAAANYDRVVVNLDDETALRFVLFLHAHFTSADPFLEKIVVVLGDRVTEKLLRERISRCHTILAEALAAKFIAQLAFQRSLEPLFAELAAPAGCEFTPLEIDRQVPRAALSSRRSAQEFFLRHSAVYVGLTTGAAKNFQLDAAAFEGASHVVVLTRPALENPAYANGRIPAALVNR